VFRKEKKRKEKKRKEKKRKEKKRKASTDRAAGALYPPLPPGSQNMINFNFSERKKKLIAQ